VLDPSVPDEVTDEVVFVNQAYDDISVRLSAVARTLAAGRGHVNLTRSYRLYRLEGLRVRAKIRAKRANALRPVVTSGADAKRAVEHGFQERQFGERTVTTMHAKSVPPEAILRAL
jgi:hypothetical protein